MVHYMDQELELIMDYQNNLQFIKTEKIIYEGGPNTIREYIHVNDAARSSVDVIDKRFANKSIILKGDIQFT